MLSALAAHVPSAASAQDRVPAATGSSESVAFRPQGLPAGGFRLYPVLRVSTGYDDNVAQSEDRRRGDGSVTLAPAVTARSNWSNHQLNVDAFYRNVRYFERTVQNHDEYGAGFDGRLDVMRTTRITTNTGYARLAEQRGTPGDLFLGSRRIQYDAFTTDSQLFHQINRVGLGAGFGTATFSYSDAVDAGTAINQRFRDRASISGNARIEYQYSAVTALFVSGTYNRIDYRRRSLVDRSSQGMTVLGGVRFELSRLLRGTVGVGYIRQSFEDPRFASFSGLNYNAALSYQPTTLTSLTLTAGRRLTDSALLSVAGVLTNDIRLAAEHELLRNLLLQGHVAYSNFTYRGIDRSDNRVDVGLGARYRMNRTVSLALSGTRIAQDSGDAQGRDYKSNRIALSLVLSR